MKREEFEHTIRAAGAILGTNQLLVIGSQAIHASVERLFPEARVSIEADIAAFDDEDGTKADLIDGSIGELSIFQETYGYYAQGVTPETAVLPEGWNKRLVPFSSPATSGVTAYCLEPHDLWISKAVAARPKDIPFCKALLTRKLVRPDTLAERLAATKGLKPEVRAYVTKRIPRRSR
jgi:hypothetical protein